MTTSTTPAEDRVREYAAQIVEFAPDMTKQDADELSADLTALLSALQSERLRAEVSGRLANGWARIADERLKAGNFQLALMAAAAETGRILSQNKDADHE